MALDNTGARYSPHPLAVLHLECTTAGHDKFYELALHVSTDAHTLALVSYWGKRTQLVWGTLQASFRRSTNQRKLQGTTSMLSGWPMLSPVALRIVSEKREKGYVLFPQGTAGVGRFPDESIRMGEAVRAFQALSDSAKLHVIANGVTLGEGTQTGRFTATPNTQPIPSAQRRNPDHVEVRDASGAVVAVAIRPQPQPEEDEEVGDVVFTVTPEELLARARRAAEGATPAPEGENSTADATARTNRPSYVRRRRLEL
jgi:hypothetical protein